MNKYASPQIIGIVNITSDSFSDGGKYLSPDAAIQHALNLRSDGADIIEIGAESSNPEAVEVDADVEYERLRPVLNELIRLNVPVSVDSRKPKVQAAAAAAGASFVNDVTGFPDPLPAYVSDWPIRLVVVYSVQRARRADYRRTDPGVLLDSILQFFGNRIDALTAVGVTRDRLILDPGMGYFLGANPEASVHVLRNTSWLCSAFGLPVMISASRKSFIRHIAECDIAHSGPASLVAELFAATAGATFIRTHNPASLRQGLRVQAALGYEQGILH